MSLTEEEQNYSINKKIHFTYKEKMDMSSLCQGDILNVTDDLSAVLKNIHPYFLNEHYKYFMVLSQSCDLVRRDGKNCKTPYITLAAVKSYDSFLKKTLIGKNMAEEIGDFLFMDERKKTKAYQLIERIYNNTESEYFFLYKEDALDFPESMIAYLQVSIALKSDEHYEKCLAAKKMELSDEFKAKLGWLIGDIYSRVGTTDWEGIKTSQERQQMLNDDLTSKCIIGKKEQLSYIKKEMAKNPERTYSRDDITLLISNLAVKTKYEEAMDIIEDIFRTSSKKIPKDEKEILLNKIKSRSALKNLLS